MPEKNTTYDAQLAGDTSTLGTSRRYHKVPNELGDGQHWVASRAQRWSGCTKKESDDAWCLELGRDLLLWLDEASLGDQVTFGVVELTDEEFDALEDI